MNAISGHNPAWEITLQSRRVRTLGEVLAPPRPLYFTHIPFILAFTGTVSWIIASEYAMVACSIVGGAIGCYMLYDWLVRGETRFSTIIAFSLLVAYGFGTFNTWATTSRGGLSLGEFIGYDDSVLARGLATVLISCSVTIFLGELFERPLFGRDFRLKPDPRVYTFLYIGAAIALLAFATGSLNSSDASNDAAGHQSVLQAFLLSLLSPLIALSTTVFLLTPRGVLHKKAVGAATLVLLMLLVFMGRRTMIYTVIETVFLARICGVRLRGSPTKKILAFLIVVVFVVTSALGFMLFRIAGYGGSAGTRRTVVDRVIIIGQWIRQGTALQTALTSTQSNVQTRTFVLGFFADILEASGTHTPGMGEDTIGLLQVAIPSALYPQKDRFFNEEALTDRLYGFAYKDEANTLLTNGATDFGFLGAIFFPLAVASVLKVIMEFALWRLDQFAALTVTLGTLFVCLSAETTLSGFASVLLHELFFSIGVLIFFALPRFKLQR